MELSVFGEYAASRFERNTRGLAFERGREITFKNLANITGGRNAVRVGLDYQGRFKLLWKFNHHGRFPFSMTKLQRFPWRGQTPTIHHYVGPLPRPGTDVTPTLTNRAILLSAYRASFRDPRTDGAQPTQ